MMQFCTYFDIKYIHKGLALYQSLVEAAQPFTLWILCFGEATHDALAALRLPHVRLVREADFERDDDALQSVKSSRSNVEYYWTCTPSLPLYIFAHHPNVDLLIYLDADTFLFSSPAAIVDELGRGSVLIIPHDYAKDYDHEASGVYNVGIMAFRRDADGMAALTWWRERCIEWCYWRHEDGKIGDQAYLNDWPDRFGGVVVSSHVGINAAPWNVAKYGVAVDDRGGILIGSRPLVCFHFHGCYIHTRVALIAGFKVAIPTSRLALIYRPYLAHLFAAERLLAAHGIAISVPTRRFPWRYVIGRVARRQPVRHFLWIGRSSRA
jgi:hypothetical protein